MDGNLAHGDPLSPNKCRRLFASASLPHPQPCDDDTVPAFPPYDDDDYNESDSGAVPPNININISPPANVNVNPLPNINVNATPSPITSLTLFSNYNYDTGEETFPINVPAEENSIICSIILATSSIASTRPFQVFAIYCMVFLFSQIIYLIHKPGEGKLLIIITVAAMLRGVIIVMVPLIGL